MVGSVGWQKTALARKERVKRRGKYSAERDKIVGHLLDRTRERGCEVMGKTKTMSSCKNSGMHKIEGKCFRCKAAD
ncbi:hypothetical protein T4A_12652 [Trichinella pseudospiralis]|uniref:Uncharacterized protein n=1 Tax=Trichinella pseudospiralis TaxID=6337 RepID=A0A0V1DTU4_TRIPS|nr:hypothetical protein T4A_12652 [Trichinella pseudospiralis]